MFGSCIGCCSACQSIWLVSIIGASKAYDQLGNLDHHPSGSSSIRISMRYSVLPSVIRPSFLFRSGRPSARPSFCPLVWSSVRPSVCPSFGLVVRPSVRPSVHPSIRLSFNWSGRPSVRFSIWSSFRPFVRPLVCNYVFRTYVRLSV